MKNRKSQTYGTVDGENITNENILVFIFQLLRKTQNKLFLSSHQSWAQVSFSYQNLFVVRRCRCRRCCRRRCCLKLFTFSFSSPEPPSQF